MKRPLKFRAFGCKAIEKLHASGRPGTGSMAMGVLWGLVLLTVVASCKSGKNNMSDTPFIEFEGLSPASVKSGGSSGDSVKIGFSFKDGDGDIGSDKSVSPPYPPEIFMIDSRERGGKHDTGRYNFPISFDSGLFDPKDGLEGFFTVSIATGFLVLDSLHLAGDTMHYDVYILDRAGNQSNMVRTDDIYIRP